MTGGREGRAKGMRIVGRGDPADCVYIWRRSEASVSSSIWLWKIAIF
jgi:hypothetical protein